MGGRGNRGKKLKIWGGSTILLVIVGLGHINLPWLGFFYINLKKSTTANTKKSTTILTVTFMARKDTRSPGPHHECHLQFNYKFNEKNTQKFSRMKKGGGAATFRH